MYGLHESVQTLFTSSFDNPAAQSVTHYEAYLYNVTPYIY